MMATSIQKGQVPKSCDLCETEIKINWKCVNCKLLMCTKCKDKVHSKFQSADKHKIIDIKEVGQHSEELDFSNLNCKDHKGQICFMFCRSCDQLVCPQCIAEVHNGHGLVQISEGFKIQIEDVKEIQQQIKSHIEELTNGESKIKLLRQYETSKYTEIKNRIQVQNVALKREVDNYTEKLIKELDQKWETLQNSMEDEERKVTAMKKRKEDQNTKAKDIINSNDADHVFKESKQLGTFSKDAVEPIKLDYETMPEFIPGEINENNFGSFKDMSKDLELNIYKQFTTDIDRVLYLSTCPDDSLWISDNCVLQRIKPEGTDIKVILNYDMKVYCMEVTPSNDLLLVTDGQSRLKQISGSSGQIIDSVYSVDPFTLTAVHVTSDYKVMVGANDNVRGILIRMNKEGQHEKTYQHDRNKQPIFTYVKHITATCTTNDKIFVVDHLSDDHRGRIVVLGQDGDVLNIYTGHPKINSDEKPFKPLCVLTTSLDNIIVNPLDTDTLHILNSGGYLITYLNTANIGILRSYSLSFTSSGQLYIGSVIKAGSTDKDSLYLVDISQI